MLKRLVKRIVQFLLTPVRLLYRSRNGVNTGIERHELPNDAFLALVSEKLAKGKAGRIVRKCTSVNPDERYQSVEKLYKAL